MSKTKPYAASFSGDELQILQCALWHWEDIYRSSRQKAKTDKRESDVRECNLKIAAIRNLKARMFRAEKAVQP